jgi:hypothetical protein
LAPAGYFGFFAKNRFRKLSGPLTEFPHHFHRDIAKGQHPTQLRLFLKENVIDIR